MKKILALALAAVLCTACFAGCEKKEDENDYTTVTVWSGDAGGQAVWERLVDEWNETTGKEKGIKIDWVTSTDSQRIDVAQQSGQLPELIAPSGTQVKKFVPTGDLIPIEELPGGAEFLAEYDLPGVEGSNVFDGKQYSVSRKSVTAGLVYNKELFKKAGIVDENGEAKAPESIADIREAAKKITDTKKGIYGFAFPLKFSTSYTIDAQTTASFGVNEKIKIDHDKLTVDYAGYKDSYQWILDMKEDGTVFPGAETLDNDTARAYFSNGSVGMIPAISWDVGVYTTQFVPNFEWDVCEFPILDGHERFSPYQARSGGFYISKNALAKGEAVMEVYKFIFSLNSRTTMFEEGIELSCKNDVIENADMSKVDPRFKKFGEFVDVEKKFYPSAGTYVTEGESWQELFQKVWMGQLTLDDAIKDISSRATTGLKEGVEKGTYDAELGKEIQAQQLKDQEEWIKNNR